MAEKLNVPPNLHGEKLAAFLNRAVLVQGYIYKGKTAYAKRHLTEEYEWLERNGYLIMDYSVFMEMFQATHPSASEIRPVDED